MKNQWKILNNGTGDKLAIDGGLGAAAMPGQLVIWQHDELIGKVQRETAMPGYPRIGDSKVYWGDGYYDLTERKHVQLFHTEKTVLGATELMPGQSLVPIAYAWHKKGKLMALSYYLGGINHGASARVVMADMVTGEKNSIWEEIDMPPSAIHISDTRIIIGAREPAVYDHAGMLLHLLKPQVPPFRVGSSEDEKWLLIAQHAVVAIWDLQTMQLHRQWQGQWIDAAISPDGKMLAMVDFDGKIHLQQIEDPAAEAKLLPASDPVQSVSLNENKLIASFARGEKIRTIII
jgi:hypothetical protein